MLRICDLNQIIKHYAYKIQQRIEELDHFRSYQYKEEDDQEDLMLDAISKYAGQVSTDEKDIQFAVKFKERVMQIYDFFKSKSTNQNILNAIQVNIERQLENFITTDAVRLGDMFSYVHLIVKRGCVIRPTAQKRPIISRSTFKTQTKSEKTPPPYSLFNIQRRPSTSSKGVKTTGIDRWRMSELAEQLWNGLQFDRPHLFRIREGNEQLIAKEMLRRNQKARMTIRQSERRKTRVQNSQELRSSTILSQLKPNTMKGVWNSKKRASALINNKKNKSAKENLSLFA